MQILGESLKACGTALTSTRSHSAKPWEARRTARLSALPPADRFDRHTYTDREWGEVPRLVYQRFYDPPKKPRGIIGPLIE